MFISVKIKYFGGTTFSPRGIVAKKLLLIKKSQEVLRANDRQKKLPDVEVPWFWATTILLKNEYFPKSSDF